MEVKCPECQFENPDDTIYCGKCAAPLKSAEDIGVTKTLETPAKGLTVGATFGGRYQIIEELGKGGMGAVYKALDTQINEEVAIKLIRPDIASDEKTLERFSNELKLARKISHKNVCRMYHLEKGEEIPYISMEYLEGEDLKRIIGDQGKLSPTEAVGIAKQVCEGLVEAHRLGVVHRDLKPQNIMIDKDGQAKIMDFGIARSVEAPGVTATGVIIGTPDYISPEQADGKEADERSDIYSLGIILYEMVTGSVPFRGNTALSVAIKHKTQLPSDPRKLNPEVSDDLARLILICMEKNKERRYPTVADLLTDLTNIEEGFPLGTKIRPRRQTFLSIWVRHKLFIPALVLALIIIAFAIWQFLPQKAPTSVSSGVPSLIVLPFDNISMDANLDDWRNGLPLLMLQDLFQSQLINVLPDDQIFEILKALDLQDAYRFSSDDLIRIAKQGEIDYVARGSIMRAGEKIILNLIVQNPTERKILKSSRFECQGEDDIITTVDEMTLDVKDALQFTQEQISADIDEQAGAITSNSPEALKYYLEGRKYHQNLDMKKAIECMKRAIAIDPNFAMAYRSMGSAYGNMRYSREWREAMDKALELSEHVSLRERLLIQGNALRDPKKGFEAYQKVLERYPFDGAANMSLGLRYAGREDFEKAIEHYETAIKNNFFNPMIINNLILANLNASRFDEAEKLCSKYYDMLSKYDAGLLVSVYINQGKYERALEETKKLGIPTSGTLLLLKGDFDGAGEKYREQLESEEPGTQFNGLQNLSYLYKAQGKFIAAEEELRKALEVGEQYNQEEWLWYALKGLINLKLALSETEEALADWEKYEEAFQPIYITWLMDLKIKILVKMKDFDEAGKIAPLFKESLDAWIEWRGANKHIRYWYFLQGLIALEQDKLPKAILHLKDAVSLLSAGGDVTEHARFIETLARAYYKSGDLDEAREQYERITRLTRGRQSRGDIYALSFYMLGRIHEQQGKKSKAKENYEKFLDLWKDADPGIAEVEDAKKRLSELV